MTNKEMAQKLETMDRAIRMINNEGNGIVAHWQAMFVADGDKWHDIAEYSNLATMYHNASEYFANSIARLVINGDFTPQGFTKEFYRA